MHEVLVNCLRKPLLGDSVGRARSGVPIDLSTQSRPTFFPLLEFNPPSKSGSEPPLCIPAAAQSRKGLGRLGSPK